MTEMMIVLAEVTNRAQDLPDNGGPWVLLPAAALLLGSGLLTYAILRRGNP